MRCKNRLYLSVAAIAGVLAAAPAELRAQTAVAIDNDDIGGTVTGASGPEAGVWVIAETTDLPTRYAKMVVTDDQGRYVVPDLPKAKYKVWVRGYGLINSPKVDGEPGKQLDLKAVAAPNEAAAAQYYPAIYWYSMLKIPEASQFGGKSDIPEKITQAEWLTVIKNRACVGCHQLGQLSTRTIPAAFGEFKSGEDAWRRRTMSGQAAPLMINPLAGYLGGAPYKYFGDWTDRVAKGELPHSKPPRPQGVERNIVVTTWDWGNEKQYLHDLISIGPPQSDRQRQRQALRLARIRDRRAVRSSIPRPHGHQLQGAGAGSEDAGIARPGSCGGREAGRSVGLLGRGEDLGHPGQQSQLDVRRQRTGLARRGDPRTGQSGLLQEGLRPSLRQGLPDRDERRGSWRSSIRRR